MTNIMANHVAYQTGSVPVPPLSAFHSHVPPDWFYYLLVTGKSLFLQLFKVQDKLLPPKILLLPVMTSITTSFCAVSFYPTTSLSTTQQLSYTIRLTTVIHAIAVTLQSIPPLPYQKSLSLIQWRKLCFISSSHCRQFFSH